MRKLVLGLAAGVMATVLYAACATADTPVPAADQYLLTKGAVTIATVDAHTIGVVVDDGAPYRHLFRLWSETPFRDFRAASKSVFVEFREGELVLLSRADGWMYVLGTDKSAELKPPGGVNVTSYRGYGLNHEIRRMTAVRGTVAPADFRQLFRESK